jgi:hypothetical protein
MAAMARILPDFLSLRPENGGTQAATPKLPRGPRPGSIRRECGRSQLLPTRRPQEPASKRGPLLGGWRRNKKFTVRLREIPRRDLRRQRVEFENFFTDLNVSSPAIHVLWVSSPHSSFIGKPLSRLRKKRNSPNPRGQICIQSLGAKFT